jgi:hypothetical protein
VASQLTKSKQRIVFPSLEAVARGEFDAPGMLDEDTETEVITPQLSYTIPAPPPGTTDPIDIAIWEITERSKCKADPIYFIRNYVKLYEPRQSLGGPKIIDFDLFPFQEDYVKFLEAQYQNGRGATVPKCRDMGITLSTLAWIFWHWLFTPQFTALIGSLKEEEVKLIVGEYDPLFSKLDMYLKYLAPFLKPTGWNANDHQQSMTLTNPATGAAIMGSSMTDNFGLGRRRSVIYIDEAAQLKRDVSGQCQQSTSTVILTSTVNGSNHFMTACERAEETGELFSAPYHLNPQHDEAWLQRQRETTDKVDFDRFILMKFMASLRGRVYEDFASVPISEEYDYTPALPLFTTADYGIADDTVYLFVQEDLTTGDIFVIDEIVANNQDIEFFVPLIPGSLPLPVNPYRYTSDEEAGRARRSRWKTPVMNFGDKSGKARSQNSKDTTWGILKRYGIPTTLDDRYYYDMSSRTRITRQALKHLHVHPRCKRFIKAMQNYMYEAPKVGGTTSGADPAPIHDEHSHPATAFEFYCISRGKIPRGITPDGTKADANRPPQYLGRTASVYALKDTPVRIGGGAGARSAGNRADNTTGRGRYGTGKDYGLKQYL